MGLIITYIPNPNKKEVRKVARHLLQKRLIACANIYESQSLYWWKDKIESAKEFILISKTTNEKFEAVKKEVEKIHSYEIPCIIKIPVSSNEKYFEWVKEQIKK